MAFQVNRIADNLEFDRASNAIKIAIRALIRIYRVTNVWVDGGQHLDGYRIDSDPAGGGKRKIQMQKNGRRGGQTYATILVDNTDAMQNRVQFNGLAFKRALEDALNICQDEHKNVSITWQ